MFTLVAYPSAGGKPRVKPFSRLIRVGAEKAEGGVPRFARLRVNCKVMTRGEKKTKGRTYPCTGLFPASWCHLIFEKRPA